MLKAKTYKVKILDERTFTTKIVDAVAMSKADAEFAITIRYIGWRILEVKEVNANDTEGSTET